MEEERSLMLLGITWLCTWDCIVSNTSSIVYNSFILVSIINEHKGGTTLCALFSVSMEVTVIFTGPKSGDILENW
jgi:hypothetical protein